MVRLPSSREIWLGVFLSAGALLGGAINLQAWGTPQLGCWLLIGSAGAAYLWAYTWAHLDANRPTPTAPPYPSLGLANGLTLSRGVALALLAGFLCPGPVNGAWRWLPAALYTFVALSDWWDGFLARITGRPSLLGAQLDLLLDGAGVLLAAALAVRLGRLPWWYLSVGLARYLYLGWLAWLRRRGHTPEALPPDPQRRATAGLMMSFLAAALWPVFAPQALTVVGIWFFVPFMGGFFRDALQAAGYRLPGPARRLPRHWGMAGVRWVAAGATVWLALRAESGQMAAFGAALGLALGLLPRLSALGALLALGLTWGTSPPAAFALTTALLTATAFYGGGAACLWAPDDRFFLTSVGRPRTEDRHEEARAA